MRAKIAQLVEQYASIAFTELPFMPGAQACPTICSPQATLALVARAGAPCGLLGACRAALCRHWSGGGRNFGPQDSDVRSMEKVLKLTSQCLAGGLNLQIDSSAQPHEARLLKLDCSKSMSFLGWKPPGGLEEALAHTCEWYSRLSVKRSMNEIRQSQIIRYSHH